MQLGASSGFGRKFFHCFRLFRFASQTQSALPWVTMTHYLTYEFL